MVTRRRLLQSSVAVAVSLALPQGLGSGTVAAQAPSFLDPLTQPKFAYEVPNPLHPSFIFGAKRKKDQQYSIGMYPIQQQLGLVDPATGAPLLTSLWGYGQNARDATFPGKTFEVMRDEPLDVQWTNNLVDGSGNPVPHLLPVDTGIHWCYSLHEYDQYTIEANGVPVVPHIHGGHTESASDGLPEAFWSPGETITGPHFVKSLYHYDNDQEAGTVWYHDHALGITRLNVYAGLAGFYIIRDERDTGLPNNPLGLPAYPEEIALAIQDRSFWDNGQLRIPTELADEGFPGQQPGQGEPSVIAEFFGDHILVNGVIWPKMEVKPRPYRLRLLNGSDSRFYVLRLVPEGGQPVNFYQIGTDDGFLPSPVELSQLVLGPGERADLVMDFSVFSTGTRIIMRNFGPDAPFGGIPQEPEEMANPETTGLVMAFDVGAGSSGDTGHAFDPTVALRPNGEYHVEGPVAVTRQLGLFEGEDGLGRLQPLLGAEVEGEPGIRSLAWFQDITEHPALDDAEIWEIYNTTMDTHPIHVHLVSFEIINRESFTGTVEQIPQPQHDGSLGVGGVLTNINLLGDVRPPQENERGPKDTAQMYPGEVTRVKARFDRPGRYVWHCHILSHEDHEMMRPYEVVVPAGAEASLSTAATEGGGGGGGNVTYAPQVQRNSG